MTDLDLLKVRVIVTDAEALGRLEPAAVRAYLANAGWTRARERATGAIWTRRLDGGEVASVFLPSDPSFADFALRTGVLLSALAIVEDRSQLAVLADLGTANAPVPSGAERIAAERRRQVEAKGYDEAHDDRHEHGELIEAARCYAYAAQVAEWYDLADWFGLDAEGRVKLPAATNARWPWSPRDWKPTGDPVRDLTKAGALVAAEIDRLLRKAARRPAAAEEG